MAVSHAYQFLASHHEHAKKSLYIVTAEKKNGKPLVGGLRPPNHASRRRANIPIKPLWGSAYIAALPRVRLRREDLKCCGGAVKLWPREGNQRHQNIVIAEIVAIALR